MWQNWTIAILGLWIIFLPFLGLPQTADRLALVATGIVVAVLGFWAASGGSHGVSPKEEISGPPGEIPKI